MLERKDFHLEVGPLSLKDGWFAKDMFACLFIFWLETKETEFVLQIIGKVIDDLQYSVPSL